MDLPEVEGRGVVDRSGSVQGPVTGSCEHSIEGRFFEVRENSGLA